MKIILERTIHLADGLWECETTAEERRFFGPSTSDPRPFESATGKPTAAVSVLLLNERPEQIGDQLVFTHSAIRFLTRGSTGRTVVILNVSDVPALDDKEKAMTPEGDLHFLTSLPDALRIVGTELLTSVREFSDGGLQFAAATGRYVERPNNFWTVKIQPRDVSLRITVRGEPAELPGAASLQIKPDQHGYSTFKVMQQSQLHDALTVVRHSCFRRRA